MSLITQKFVSLVGALVLTTGFGAYCLTGMVVGQETGAPQIKANAPDEPPSAGAPAATLVTQAPRARAAGAGAPTLNRGRKAILEIERTLDEQTESLDFNEESLDVVMAYFQDVLGFPIVIDWRALEDAGHDNDNLPRITLNINEISARSGLHLVLDGLELDYAIENETLLITTPEEAEAKLDTRVHRTNGSDISADELLELITSTIDPDSWDEVGGPGVARALKTRTPTLVISQTVRVHKRIEDLLEQLSNMPK